MALSQKERDVLRGLAYRYAEIASLGWHQERAKLWQQLNARQSTRPLVRIFQIPWQEFPWEEELRLVCEDPWARSWENYFRQMMYQWQHIRDDLVWEPVLYCQKAIHDTGFGISEISDVNDSSGIASRHFHEQIDDFGDLEKIKFPQVWHDEAATEQNCSRMQELFGEILPVRTRGVSHFWFAPWDQLITWYGVEKAMLDMKLRPELVKAAISRLVDAWLHRLDQYEKQDLLSLPPAGEGVGSGGLGLTEELPPPDYNPDHIRPQDLWGCATPQIFSDVSPSMHEEFALQFEMRWLERWGLNYYGCCEPLHTKIPILRQIPRLRKISCSPRADKAAMAEQCGRDYVISLKPNPAIFTDTYWSPERARAELRADLEKLQGCVVEIIMKDISTVSCDPQRLWQWAQIAQEEAERFAS